MASGIAETKQVGFEPSPWGDFFIQYEPQPLQRSEEWMMARADKLKEEVHMMFNTCSSMTARMFLLDTLQHLGINHHFEEQIQTTLRELFEGELGSSASLHEEALRFRLLREHGHWVSPDVFNKFKGEDGTFHKDITTQPSALLSLYNAAHLLIHGEAPLEEAITFARHHLELVSGSLKSPLAEQVKRALHRPFPRTCKRVETLHYISEYEEEEGHSPILLELAKLDFNLLQHVHLKELKTITEWDESAVSLLPKYLKKFYIELLRTFKNIEGEMPIDINYDIAHLKKAIQNNVTGYLQEAEWSHRNYKPSFIDQVNLTSRTVGAPTECVSMMAGMDDAIMKEALKWTADVPDVVVAAGKIVRFMNDIAAFERGKCNRDVASSVECYINEYCVTSDVAIARIDALIEEEWRTLNQARFRNRALLPALQRIIGLALSASLIYDNRKDVYTVSKHLHKTIEGLFVNPM